MLGLKAAAATAPYDTPAWLPEVLVALAGAASLPPPIGKVETKITTEMENHPLLSPGSCTLSCCVRASPLGIV